MISPASSVTGHCWSCTNPLSASDYGRQDSCPKCGRDTHVCLGCFFNDRNYNNECKEPQADRVVDKEKSNFCDYFKPKLVTSGNSNPISATSSRDAALAAAEALFKKK